MTVLQHKYYVSGLCGGSLSRLRHQHTRGVVVVVSWRPHLLQQRCQLVASIMRRQFTGI
jgi:hypothetical protein